MSVGAPAADWLGELPWPAAGAPPAALRACLELGERRIAEAFANRVPAELLVRERARLIDRLLLALWPPDLPGALLATGGYGRGELFPRSDVDLLVLVAEDPEGASAARLAALKAALWDLGLRPGWAVRTPEQTLELARGEVATATALLEARRIAGDGALAGRLFAALADPGFWPAAAYFRAKMAERAARHRRFHDTAYNLEPNLKDGPGGLRDLQTLEWIAARIHGPGGLARMRTAGELSEGEWQELAAARATLTGLRFALHLLAGRAEERLLFDHQRELARRFGYRDEHAENLAVEQFMQTYYRAAHAVDRLGEILLERLAEQLEEPERQPALRLSLDFRLVGARIEAVDAGIFLSRPAAMVELFGAFAEHREATAIAAPTALALAAALPLVAARLPEDARALRAFLDILGRPGGVFRALSRMHRHGVLGALLPPFAAVTGRMQYDLFHAYTVDQHTLFVLRELDRLFDAGEADGEALPRAVAAQLRRPAPLYLAALFHDIAKGRGGDHSELGAAEARRFAARLGLGAGEAELIAWLVEAHLLMSRTAQREDIQDPAVVARFASAVGDRERLDLLYLLTVADIAATHPKLWNRWKAQLLAELYDAARLALRRGLASSPRRAERIAERRAATAALLAGAGLEGARLEAIWAEFPEDAFLRYEPDQLAWQTVLLAERGGDAAPLVAVRSPAARAATEVFVLCPDMDGLFAAIAATLDRLELDVLAARIATTPRGLAFDTFLVHERDGGAVRDPARERAIAETLRRALAERPLRAEPVRRVLPRRQRHFARPPRIELTARGGLTELLLVCTDRPGLLATVARILRDEGLRVHEARIATLGERAEDIFLISDREGRPLAAEAEAGLAARLVEGLGEQWEESAGRGAVPARL